MEWKLSSSLERPKKSYINELKKRPGSSLDELKRTMDDRKRNEGQLCLSPR